MGRQSTGCMFHFNFFRGSGGFFFLLFLSYHFANDGDEFYRCVVCMNLDTTLTSPLPSECAANLAATSATRTGSSTRTSSSSTRTSSSSSRAPTSAASSRTVSGSANSQTAATRPATTPVQTAPVAPSATGGNLQGFGGCPDGACSGGDSSKTNIYDVTKDSDKVSGAGGVEGARLGWCGVFGLAAMGGIVWL